MTRKESMTNAKHKIKKMIHKAPPWNGRSDIILLEGLNYFHDANLARVKSVKELDF